MKKEIALITILTDNVPVLSRFYQNVMGFEVSDDMGEYVEFKSDGVRFAVCSRAIMESATGDASYKDLRKGHSFELAILELVVALRIVADQHEYLFITFFPHF
ncbi:MAG: hypothetical protein P8Y03_14890 [Anaerolineales bacterium]